MCGLSVENRLPSTVYSQSSSSLTHDGVQTVYCLGHSHQVRKSLWSGKECAIVQGICQISLAIGNHLESRQGYHVKSHWETKQYPLLDDKEIACCDVWSYQTRNVLTNWSNPIQSKHLMYLYQHSQVSSKMLLKCSVFLTNPLHKYLNMITLMMVIYN